ncbi:MAG: MATE family efflux transporter [Acidimicrobiia bacterium]
MNALDRRIVALALPALGTLAIEPLYTLVDTAIVGRLGTDPLAGLALAAVVLSTTVACCNFLAYGTTPRVAGYRGAGQPERAATIAAQALWICAAIGVPIAVIIGLAARPIARLLGGDGAVLDAAVTYLRISAVGLPFVMVALVGHGVQRGLNKLAKPLVIVAVANVVNVIGEVLFVYVFDLGVAGSAWSTVIVQIATAVWFIALLQPQLTMAATRRWLWAEIQPLLAAGRHLIVRVASITVVFVVSTSVAARIDTPTLAAHQIVAQMFLFLALAVDALAIPGQSLVAEALGAGDRVEAARIGRAVMRLSLLTGAGVAAVLAFLSPLAPHAFTGDGAVVSRAAAGLAILAILQLPAGITFGLDGVLIGTSDFRFLGRAAAATAPVAVIGLVAVGTLTPSLGIAGIWLAQLVWMVTRAATNRHRFAVLLAKDESTPESRRGAHDLTP